MNSATTLFTPTHPAVGYTPNPTDGSPSFTQAVPASQVPMQAPHVAVTTVPLNAIQQAQLSQINSLAPAYQAQASEHRLTGRSQNQQLRQGSKIKTSINEQRKDGKEGKLASLQIAALAYFLHNAEFKEPTLLSQVGPFSEVFLYQPSGSTTQLSPPVSVSGVIDCFLSKVADRIAEVFPGSRPVTSENVELRIKDASKKTLWALDKPTRQGLNALTGIDGLYRLAVSRGWMTIGQHSLTIAFIVNNDEVILEMIGKTAKKKKRGASEALQQDDHDWDDSSSDRSTVASRPSRQTRPSKRQSIISTFRRPSGPSGTAPSSAVRTPPKFKYKMITFTVQQACKVDAGTGEVTFFAPDEFFLEDEIGISEDFVKGYDLLRGITSSDLNPATYNEHGVLGRGYYKLGVEACYKDTQMAFLFYHGDGFGPTMASEEAKAGLMLELEALKLGQEVFLPVFEQHLHKEGFKTLPKLRFNSEQAFLGQIDIPEPITVRKVDVQHPQGYPDGRTTPLLDTHGWFLATPLLPYGPTKPKVIKFTGVDGDGESPRDASDHDKLAEEVVQTFAHFVYIYSKESRLLADLQGVWAADGTKTVTLIDPQLLKSEIPADQRKIETYMKNHVCRRLCHALRFDDTKAASPSPSQFEDEDLSGDYKDDEDQLDDDE
ncbi:hypothetical protein FRC04_008036 [Tulasnella sp. 424]|nr:hypothetical protein FRC04_008036 [Tulasnella sp. 424]